MTIDTNILIAYLGGDSEIVTTLSNWKALGRPLFLSAVVESEVLSFKAWTDQEKEATELFLEENFTPIPFDRALARVAAAIRRETKLKFPDAAIAATALYTLNPLVTRNVRDFKGIAGLRI